MLGGDLRLEADPAHPLRHLPPVALPPVPGTEPFPTPGWQALGVFKDRDLRRMRLGRQTAFDDVRRGERLNDAVCVLERMFRAADQKGTELRRADLQPGNLAGPRCRMTRSRGLFKPVRTALTLSRR